ncbi:hypothetical protein KW790_02275 [Candidatus Parcubacteria bacterium]|nr:hypothetical protein [Candidatus Parcubacteria bacterium]
MLSLTMVCWTLVILGLLSGFYALTHQIWWGSEGDKGLVRQRYYKHGCWVLILLGAGGLWWNISNDKGIPSYGPSLPANSRSQQKVEQLTKLAEGAPMVNRGTHSSVALIFQKGVQATSHVSVIGWFLIGSGVLLGLGLFLLLYLGKREPNAAAPRMRRLQSRRDWGVSSNFGAAALLILALLWWGVPKVIHWMSPEPVKSPQKVATTDTHATKPDTLPTLSPVLPDTSNPDTLPQKTTKMPVVKDKPKKPEKKIEAGEVAAAIPLTLPDSLKASIVEKNCPKYLDRFITMRDKAYDGPVKDFGLLARAVMACNEWRKNTKPEPKHREALDQARLVVAGLGM